MNEISPQQILSQIRSLQSELQTSALPAVAGKESAEFGTLIKHAIGEVSETQSTAAAMTRDFVSGTSDASLAEVMIATQKADLSFRAVTEVRNKLVTAYQEIMNMPV